MSQQTSTNVGEDPKGDLRPFQTEQRKRAVAGFHHQLDLASERISQLERYRKLQRRSANNLREQEKMLRLQSDQFLKAKDDAVEDLQSGLELAIKGFWRSIETLGR